MDRGLVSKYFDENSTSWIQSSYEGDDYTFSTARARARQTINILDKMFPTTDAHIVDLGCGAGQLCLPLAQKGYRVIGIDESPAMLSEAINARALLPESVQSRLHFVKRDLLHNGLDDASSDGVTALGVIGYLPDDEALFVEAARLLRVGGHFIVSCRNRLFNMVSLSDYTLREIEQGGATELVKEIRELFRRVPDLDTVKFLQALATVSDELISHVTQGSRKVPRPPEPVFTTSVEARQHTPKGILQIAARNGFAAEGFYGVHPHFMMAGLNRSFPPSVFNLLSMSLETLSDLPISLIWSSVFISVFRKTG